MIYSFRLLLIFLFTFTTLNYGIHNLSFVKDDINFNYSSFWSLSEKKNSIHLLHTQNIATINIIKIEMNPIVTANTLQEERSASLYDGWMKILSRKSSQVEIEKSNVEDAHINVFLKQKLNSKLNLIEYIIGEYYYIKNQYSYIISVETSKSNWPYIQNDLKLFLSSFWIGTGQRPEFSQENQTITSWTSPGNKYNSNFINASPKIQTKLKLNWEFEVNSDNNYSSFPIVSESNDMYFLHNNNLIKLNYESGNIEWNFKIEGDVNPHYLSYNSSLIFVLVTNPSPALIAYSSDTGEKIYSINLHKRHSIAEFNSNAGFINDNGIIKAFEIYNGKLLWERNLNAALSTPLIVTDKRLLYQKKDTGEIIAISPSTANHIWTQQPCMLSKELSVSNSIIYLPIKHSSGADKLFAVDINTGKTLWTFDKTILNFIFENTISSSKKVSVFSGTIMSENNQKSNILLCINNQTGAIEWEKVLNEPIHRSIVTKSNLFSLSKYTKSIIVLDLLTGEKIPVERINTTVNDINIYKDYLIKIIIKDNNFIIQCFS